MQGDSGGGGAPGGAPSKPNLFKPEKPPEDDEERKGPYLHLPRHGAAWLLMAGALMMFLTLVAPWWSWSMSSNSQSSGLYLFIWGIDCFGYSCPGYSPTPIYAPTSPTLQAGNFLTNLGLLYGTAAALSIIAALFGAMAAMMLFKVARGEATYAKSVDRAVLLAYLGVVIAFATPVMLAVAQTSSFRADYSFPINLNPNPGTSFYGSAGSFTSQNVQFSGMSWGPSWGWFLSIFGGVFLFAGGFVPHLTRDEAVTRSDLIRQGLLKLRAPLVRAVPAAFRPGLPSAATMGPGPRALPAGQGYPGYQSIGPGVGWARAPPPGMPGAPRPVAAVAPGYRPVALPAPARGGPPPVQRPAAPPAAAPPARTAYAPPNAPAFASRPAVAPRPANAPAPAAPKVCPRCLISVPPPAVRCTRCGGWL